MFAAFSAGLLIPQGDRSLHGSTTIDVVIAECLRRSQAAEMTAQRTELRSITPCLSQRSFSKGCDQFQVDNVLSGSR